MKINFKNKRFHAKASEEYVDVVFNYGNTRYETSVPIIYRRTGTHIEDTGITEYLEKVYDEVNPENWFNWRSIQKEFWATKPRATVTKEFFDILNNETFSWCCVSCELPKNPNWARRIQDLKEFGYTLATDTNKFCDKCNANTTHIALLPISRGGITGYETWSSVTRIHIVRLLKAFDSYEGKSLRKEGLLPDHKFPEIRWDSDTRRESLDELSDEEYRRDFQLLSNQRNLQKREICRKCFQTGERGTIYGIPFFYAGNEFWDDNVPKTGKAAEKGCVGCAWYDIDRWRKELQKSLAR